MKMRKAIVVLTVLVFAFSLLPVEAMARDANQVQRIKAKIREHKEAIKKLKGELRQAVGSSTRDEGVQYDEGAAVGASSDFKKRRKPKPEFKGKKPYRGWKPKRDVKEKKPSKSGAKKWGFGKRKAGKKEPARRGGGKKEPARRGGGKKEPARRGGRR
jgi:hypothetical protein